MSVLLRSGSCWTKVGAEYAPATWSCVDPIPTCSIVCAAGSVLPSAEIALDVGGYTTKILLGDRQDFSSSCWLNCGSVPFALTSESGTSSPFNRFTSPLTQT